MIRRGLAPAVLALALAGCNGGTVDRHALENDAATVASIASEGELLAHDVTKGASTKSFVRVHAGELADEAAGFAKSLGARPTSPGIEPEVRKLAHVAGRISGRLEQLHSRPTDRTLAHRLEDRLSDDADDAEALGK